MIFIYSTFPTKKEAKEIGEKLIQKKLAACVNIFPIDSIYYWETPKKSKLSTGQEKIVKDKEFVAIIKTQKKNFKKIEKFILENHSYDTPCILEIPIGRVTKKYLNWLNRAIST